VDEAFLRRIPYKVDVHDPSEEEFRQLFRSLAGQMQIQCDEDAVEYIIQQHYKQPGRVMRYCHPRDLLHQVRTYCTFYDLPPVATAEALDAAVKNYFAML